MNAIEYLDDCKMIQATLLELHIEATLIECQAFWRWRSEQFCANWLVFNCRQDEVKQWIKEYWDTTTWPDSPEYNAAYHIDN